MARADGRKNNELRPLNIHRPYLKNTRESVLIEMGDTRVICVATVEDSVPPFLRGSGQGWITAEYGMLPRSTPERIPRESIRGRIKGRTHEIQRLIGRALRTAVDLGKLGERTITVDCDVIEADGGTRTAAINGGFVALVEALRGLGLDAAAMRSFVAAVSVGVIGGKAMLDLDYEEDSTAEVDMNVVMNDHGQYIEVQGTAEGNPFSEEDLARMLKIARHGIKQVIRAQKKVLRWG